MKRLLFLAILMLAPAAKAETLILNTESYPPYSYRDDNGKPAGIGVEQVDLMLASSGIDYKIDMMPWARAIALAETQPMHCVFAAARTPEREERFKWVLPLLTDRNLLVTHSGSGVRATTLDEARTYSIGTQRDDYTVDILRSLGFEKIDLGADFNVTLTKLLGNRVDLMPMSEQVYHQLRDKGTELEAVVVLTEQQLGIACNKQISDELIATLQSALDRIIHNGGQLGIYVKYGLIRSQ